RRLKISEISPEIKRHIDGTSYGVGSKRKEHISKITKGKIKLSGEKVKIVEFLNERVEFK
ncbi:MAG: hypothetical protein JRJ27_13930, partial [Deltaproteobacteria bacterium]|nr:hypothetical protein [Deltaproteobacteria bacterium]